MVESAGGIVYSSVSDHVGPMVGGGGALEAVYGVCGCNVYSPLRKSTLLNGECTLMIAMPRHMRLTCARDL